MCCLSVELVVVPLLTIPAAILCVICMSSKNWVEAYIQDLPPDSPYLFAELSPWYLCAAECTECPSVRRTRLDCFWMRDWAPTGFSRLTAVQHLEYWCLGCLILSLFPSIIACLDRRGRLCPVHCHRPAMILIGIACVLSGSTVSVLACSSYSSLDEFTDGHALQQVLGWPYYVRMLATLQLLTAAAMHGLHEYKSRQGYVITQTDEDKVIIVPVNDDHLIEEFPEYGEPL